VAEDQLIIDHEHADRRVLRSSSFAFLMVCH
jgi:hypothetical protein